VGNGGAGTPRSVLATSALGMSGRPGTVVGAGCTLGAGFSWDWALAGIVSDGMPMIVAIKIARDDLKCEVMDFLLLNNNSVCLDDEV